MTEHNESELRVLTFTMQKGITRETKRLLDGRIIRLNFSKKSELDSIPKKTLRQYDAFCIASKMPSGCLNIVLQDMGGRDENSK